MFPRLNQNQIESIKKETERVLEKTGCRIFDAGIRKKCRQAGAIVEDENELVRFPGPLLRELLAKLPSSFTLADRRGRPIFVDSKHMYCHAIVIDPWIIDYETQKPRRPVLQDMRKHTIIAQKLDNVAAISRMDFPVEDVEEPISSMRALEEHLLYHEKHIYIFAASLESYKQWLEIGEILLEGRKVDGSGYMSAAVGVVSPLTVSPFNCAILQDAASRNFMIIPTICPMAGTTGPYSITGMVLLGNIENIMVAALTQILNPGNPFLYSYGPSVANMRSGYDMYYTLDKIPWKVAAAQMAQSYQIPVAVECGGTMSYRYDMQAGAEGMLFMLSAVSTGANFINGIGSCYNAIGMSAEMMLVHQAWLKAAGFLMREFRTDDLGQLAETIMKTGPGGNYLIDGTTLRNLRSGEFFSSDLFDMSGGFDESVPLIERAHKKVQEMVSDVRSPLPKKVQEEINRYFRKEYEKLRVAPHK